MKHHRNDFETINEFFVNEHDLFDFVSIEIDDENDEQREFIKMSDNDHEILIQLVHESIIIDKAVE